MLIQNIMMFSLNLKKKQIFDLEIKICNSLDMKDIYHFMISSIKNWFFGFFNKNISIFWKMKKGINKINLINIKLINKKKIKYIRIGK